MIEKLENMIMDGSDISKDAHLLLDELMNKHYNILDIKLNKSYLCYIKDYLCDDNLFLENIKRYKNYKGNTWKYKEERICLNCSLECNSNLHPHFEFFSAIFVMDIETRANLFSDIEKKELTMLFFKQFYEIDEILQFDEERMLYIFIRYDFTTLERLLKGNDTLINISSLIKLKNLIDSFTAKYKNLNNEIFEKIEIHKEFINNKLNTYKDIYEVENELEKITNNKSNKEVISDLHTTKETKTKLILNKLNEYGFSNLEMVKKVNIQSLSEHIFIKNTFPYKIAYLWHLGFIKHLSDNYCDTRNSLNKLLARIIETSERTVSANINGLSCEKSKDRKPRYNAYLLIKNVKEHYQGLK